MIMAFALFSLIPDKGFAYRQLNFKNYVHSEGEPFHNFLRLGAVSLSWRRPGHRSVFETQFLADSWSPGGREHREKIPSLELLLDRAAEGHRTRFRMLDERSRKVFPRPWSLLGSSSPALVMTKRLAGYWRPRCL